MQHEYAYVQVPLKFTVYLDEFTRLRYFHWRFYHLDKTEDFLLLLERTPAK